MLIEHFTPVSALLGGALIGTAATFLLALHGKIAGISGITKGAVIAPDPGERHWRMFFILGLLGGGLLTFLWTPEVTAAPLTLNPWQMVIGGLLVGVGTSMGNGCTSGHGICGLARRSPRSLAAVLTFMGVGIVTLLLMNVLGIARF